MVLLDTDILIEFFKGNDKTNMILSNIGSLNSSISSITLMELLVGVRNKKELTIINKKLREITLFQISEDISSLSIELIQAVP